MNYFNYFSEIEELFVRRRGRNLLLSPLDWALIESWQERAVPLHIILSGIERVFDGIEQQPPAAARKRTVKSLLYCKEEIEAQYAEWLERQVGKNAVAAPNGNGQTTAAQSSPQTASEVLHSSANGAARHAAVENSAAPPNELFPDDFSTAHLEKVRLEIEAARASANGDFRQTLTAVAERLAELRDKKSAAANDLEAELERLDALVDRSLLRNAATENLKSEIGKQIAAYKTKMEPAVFQKTFDLMLVKRLREQASVPRLSLFYL